MQESTATGLVKRTTITEYVATRNVMLGEYTMAYEGLDAARGHLRKVMDKMSPDGRPHRLSMADVYGKGTSVYNLHGSLPKVEKEAYMAQAREIVDELMWRRLIKQTNFEVLTDATAKKEFNDQLSKEPPEFTEENVAATLKGLISNSGMTFRRGIAVAFSSLDRRFRSHDGFKIGTRVILNDALSEYGHWQYGGKYSVEEIIRDVERVFSVLGKCPVFKSVINVVQDARKDMTIPAGDYETEFFRVKVYKNGNVHLWFKRADLVREVNKLLGEFYGDAIPNGAQAEDDPLKKRKTTPAKNWGFFPTPAAVVERLLARTDYSFAREREQGRILEPSAGTGNIASKLVTPRYAYPGTHYVKNLVDCVEIQPDLARKLAENPDYNKVYNEDFFSLTPEVTGLYDIVAMNPPFDSERDIDHVMHAWDFVKPGGYLVAVMSDGTRYRETKKSKAFRRFVEENVAPCCRGFETLPVGSFVESGTGVNTCIVRLAKKVL